MKFNEINIFIFIASIIIGVLISLNISFDGGTSTVVLSANQYQDAYNLRNKLQGDISNIKKQYNDNLVKLEKYKSDNPNSSKVLQDINNELSKNKSLLGTTEVVGKGLKITLNDASWEFDSSASNDIEKWSSLIHNTDIMLILNSLRNAGAQAISINDERVLSISEVYCFGQFIRVNGVNLPAPFYINVIGDPDVIKNYVLGQDSYLKMLRDLRRIEVNVETLNEIKIPSYNGEVKYNYMKELDK
jgi:uncharacterized protein YlxW (UPF0749 family)